MKPHKVKNCKRPYSPWITKSLLASVRKKNKLYRQLLRSPNPTRELQYKSYRNKLTHLIRIAKRHYYDQRFASAKNDLKETWKLINEVINKRKCRPPFPSSFRSDGSILTDPVEIANGFCNYFANVGPNLAAKIPPVNSSFHSFLNDQFNESLILKPTTVEELNGICMSMKSGKAPGYDDISMYVIKNTFEVVSEPLKNIINLSFSKGIFPDKLKLAKVIPVFKGDEPDLFTNYRPISLLPNFSKFFEKVMHNRLVEFANSHDIFYQLQFGFRKNHSTALSLTYLVNKIATSIDQNEITAGVFLDLSKAFDTLDHQILFEKLEHYGVCGLALQWIKSYFSNRTQFVQINDTRSSEQIIRCGVPQGSILGPLLFILYINDLPKTTRLAECLLFADDTSIFYSNSDPDHVASVMNSELTKISLWMKSNKLSVNIKKTNYVIFKPKQKSVRMSSQISLDSIPLKQVTEVKFLGIYIDEGLTWKSHISYICKKICKSVGIMYRFRFLLSSNTKKSLYYTLIYPYLTYCTTVWSSTYVTNLNRIFLLQKRAVRAMTNSNHLAPSAPLFAQLNILDIFKVNSFYIAKFMFSYHQRLLPSPFLNLFPTGGQIHNYDTRTSAHFRPHTCRTNIKQFTILYRGPKIWNALPLTITSSPSLSTFKRKLLDFLS